MFSEVSPGLTATAHSISTVHQFLNQCQSMCQCVTEITCDNVIIIEAHSKCGVCTDEELINNNWSVSQGDMRTWMKLTLANPMPELTENVVFGVVSFIQFLITP